MSTMPNASRTNAFANAHDFSLGEMKVIGVDRSTRNLQTGGVSVLNNNTYHPGSQHSNPVFHGNPDGSPAIVYCNQGPVSHPARLQQPYQPQFRSFQYQSCGRGAREYWHGLPPPPPPYQTQAQAYAASPLEDSTNLNGVPVRTQSQDTYWSTLPQSPGFPPEQFEDVDGERASPRHSMGEGTTTGSGSDREVGIIPVTEEVSPPTPPAVTSAQRPASRSYQPQPRSLQYQTGGRGARWYWPGPPPPPPPPPPLRPPLGPLRSGVRGGYATQQRFFHEQYQQQMNGEGYEEYMVGPYPYDPQHEDPQYQDSQYHEYRDPQNTERRYYRQYPQDQQQAYSAPSPKSYSEYPPPSPSTHALPFPTRSQPYSRSNSINSYYQRQEGSSSHGSLPRAQWQDTYCSTPPQSHGFPPEQFGDVDEARTIPHSTEGFRSESNGDDRIAPDEAGPPTHVVTYAPFPAPAPAPLAAAGQTPAPAPTPIPPVPAVVAGEESSPTVTSDPQPELQEHNDATSHPAPAGILSGSDHSHFAESSKRPFKGKSKRRSSWMLGLFKGSSGKTPNSDPSGGEDSEAASGTEQESKSKSKRGSFFGFAKK